MTQTVPRSADLDELLDQYAGPGLPGVAVGVYSNGEVIQTATVGLASIEHDVAVRPETMFNIASVSKQFTATCILLLEQEGKLSLDDDVRGHLPAMSLASAVTVRQCLRHTGGLREYMSLNALVGAGPETYESEEAVMRVVYAQRDTNFEPGTQWSYSNTGYIVLAAIVRAVTGQSLAEFARDRLLVPLGMHASRFQDDANAVVPHRATGYMKSLADPDTDGYRRAESHDEAVGDGGLLTNVVDLAAWDGFLADGRVLGAEIRDRLLTRAVLRDGKVLPYALGIEHSLVCGRAAVGHGGNIEGYHAHLIHLVDDGLGVAALTNRNDVDPNRVVREVAAAFLGTSRPARPPRGGRAPSSLAGLWLANDTDTFIETATNERGTLDIDFGPLTVPFVRHDDVDEWRPERLALDVAIYYDGDRLCFTSGDDDWNPVWFDRVDPATPAPDPRLPGTYHSLELDALATITATDDGYEIVTGATKPAPLRAVTDDLFRLPTNTVRVVRDASGGAVTLLFSGGRMRRVRFDRVADGTVPVGFPLAFR